MKCSFIERHTHMTRHATTVNVFIPTVWAPSGLTLLAMKKKYTKKWCECVCLCKKCKRDKQQVLFGCLARFFCVLYIVLSSISLRKCIRKSSHVTCSVTGRRDKVWNAQCDPWFFWATQRQSVSTRENELGCLGDCLSPLNRVLNCAAVSKVSRV